MIFGQPIYLQPAPGRRVRKENGQLLDAAGETVIASSYWQRRLDAGDVIEAPAPPDEAPDNRKTKT
jgi:hypothetical protein